LKTVTVNRQNRLVTVKKYTNRNRQLTVNVSKPLVNRTVNRTVNRIVKTLKI
ncbi:unnamed protein product, partial [Arabidopsis halleri]